MAARSMFDNSRSGYWEGYRGWAPSTVEWCEVNYELCSWIAEFWNSFSSLAIIAAGIVGVVLSHRHGQGELRFVLAYLAIIGVGIGSLLFHMTLLRPMQILDEVPMIYAAQVSPAPQPWLHGTVTLIHVVLAWPPAGHALLHPGE